MNPVPSPSASNPLQNKRATVPVIQKPVSGQNPIPAGGVRTQNPIVPATPKTPVQTFGKVSPMPVKMPQTVQTGIAARPIAPANAVSVRPQNLEPVGTITPRPQNPAVSQTLNPLPQKTQNPPGVSITTQTTQNNSSAVLAIKTPSGKTVADFRVPQNLIEKDSELVDYIMRSESMKDEERQYWFNLTEIMNAEQVEKLRDILKREREKLAEIDAKYGKTAPTMDPIAAAKKAEDMAKKRAEEQNIIKARENFNQTQEAKEEADILAELDEIKD